MTRPYISRVGAALSFSLRQRLEALSANEYPGESARKLIQLFTKAVGAIEKTLELQRSDREKQFAIEALISIGADLRYIDSSRSANVPVSLIPPFESLVRRLYENAEVLVRVKASYNYEVFEPTIGYRTMLSRLLEPSEVDSILRNVEPIYIISVPSLESANVLLHAVLGHELGHQLADEFIKGQDQEALLRSFEGDVDSILGNEDGEGDFQIAERQEVFDQILEARRRALEELISDVVGFELFGISALFALEEFSASDTLDDLPSEAYDYYPPWRYRLRNLMNLVVEGDLNAKISELSGGSVVASVRNAVLGRLENLHELCRTTTDKDTLSVDDAVRCAYRDIPSALVTARRFVTEKLGDLRYQPLTFSAEVGPLVERLGIGVPPDQLDKAVPDFRSAIAAGWMYRVARLAIPVRADAQWEMGDDLILSRLVEKAAESIHLMTEFSDWGESKE